jgi:type I restriction enzyme S subunit
MELKQGYVQTEVGVIPEDWNVAELGDVGECLIGLTYKPSNVKADGTLVLRSSNIQDGTLTFDDNVYVDADIPERIRVVDGDILICVRNGSRALIGKCALLDKRVEGQTFGAFMAVYRTADSAYIFQQFQSALIKRQITENIGATINQITNRNLNSFKIPFPTDDKERNAIATVLSEVDTLLAAQDKLIVKKRDIKQAAMQQLLTGKQRLPGFTGEWEVVKAGDIGSFRGGNGFPTKFQGTAVGEYPFFKVSDMNIEGNEIFMETANNYINERLRKQLGATAFPANSIVIAKVGAAVFLERKKILRSTSCLDNNMAGFVIDSSRVHYRFINYVLLNMKLGNLVSTTALPSLSGSVLSTIELHLPSLEEQTAITTILSDMDADLIALEQQRDKTRTLKQGMMQELLTGRIRLV